MYSALGTERCFRIAVFLRRNDDGIDEEVVVVVGCCVIFFSSSFVVLSTYLGRYLGKVDRRRLEGG